MTYRKTTEQPATVGERTATIAWSAEYEEFRVRLFVNGAAQPDADYFTNDWDGARRTAWSMARHRPE